MAAKTLAELAIDVSLDPSAAARGFDDVADASERAASQAETAGAGFDRAADASDNVASKSSQATGALGALAGGLEAVGLEKYAAGLQGAAIATDFASGAGDALNLVTESGAVKTAVATVNTIAHSVATKAVAAATFVAEGAQWALNAALAANPVALIVIALVALAAGFVLAYNKSETFRDIVDGAMHVVKDSVGAVIDIVGDLIDWVGDAVKPWTNLGDKIGDIMGAAGDAIGNLVDRGIDFFADLLAPVQKIIDLVQDLIDKIKSIELPSVDLNPFNGRSVFGEGGPTIGGKDPSLLPGDIGFGGLGTVIHVTVNGAVDPVSTARQLRRILEDAGALDGAPAWGNL